MSLTVEIDYKNEYHFLIQWGALYVILRHNGRKRRNRPGVMDSLKIGDFVKKFAIETNCFFYELLKVCS